MFSFLLFLVVLYNATFDFILDLFSTQAIDSIVIFQQTRDTPGPYRSLLK